MLPAAQRPIVQGRLDASRMAPGKPERVPLALLDQGGPHAELGPADGGREAAGPGSDRHEVGSCARHANQPDLVVAVHRG